MDSLKNVMTFFHRKCFPYVFATLTILTATLINFALEPYVEPNNLIMIYLVGIVFIAMWDCRRRSMSIYTVLLSTLAYNFFFTNPRLSLWITSSSDVITMLVLFTIAQIISQLTIHVQQHTEAAQTAKIQAETERIRNTLLLSISHDLRTPLTGIMGSASSLLHDNKKLTEVMRYDLIQNIYDESERLTRLISNVLQIIRIETNTIKIKKQCHLIEEIVGMALNKLEKVLSQRRIILNLAKPTPLIPLDPILIQQVLINLIENAVKFTQPNSTIEITSEFKTKHIFVKVMDEGKGIDPLEINNIFNKFYKGSDPATNGIGLGLAFCKEVMNAHGGKIWAENRKPHGAIFTFCLPSRVDHA